MEARSGLSKEGCWKGHCRWALTTGRAVVSGELGEGKGLERAGAGVG